MTMRKITELAGRGVRRAFQPSPGELAFELTDGKVTVPVELPEGPKGPPGRDGANVLPTDEAIAQAVVDPSSATRPTLDANFTGVAKRVEGGIVPLPLRVPHLVVDDAYPKPEGNHNVVWAEPSGLMYAASADRAFYKSTDHGATWQFQGTSPVMVDNQGIFLRLASGTLLGNRFTGIARSTDEGATWETVHTFRPGAVIMGPAAWAEDQHGHVYYGEYQTVGTFTDIRVYRSTDDGATWSVFHTFAGPASSDPQRIRHIHGVQYDQQSQRVYVMSGDSEAAAGIHRTNAASGATALEKVVENRDLVGLGYGNTLARSIGVMFFPDHLAWGVDATDNPYLVRLPRSEIGTPTPQAEVIYRLNATAWWTTKASDDGTVWVLCASKEGWSAIDNAVHLYAVEDSGARVYEVGSLPQRTASGTGSISPVGKPELHTDRMWLQSYNISREDGRSSRYQMSARLARGAAPLPIAPPPTAPTVLAWQSVSSGPLELTDGQGVTIGFTRSGLSRRRLAIHDWSIRRPSGNGVARLALVNLTTGQEVWTTEVTGNMSSKRSVLGRDASPWIDLITGLGPSDTLEWRVVLTTHFTGVVQVTYGWIE